MATLQGVMDALTAAIRTAVNPLSLPYVCYSGWVDQDALKVDVADGTRSHITVYPLPAEKNTTRFPVDWMPTSSVSPKLTASVSRNVITFGGTPDPAGNVAVTVNQNAPVIYTEVNADTLPTVASNVAAAINAAILAGITASASGDSVTVNGTPSPAVSVTLGAAGSLISIQRQIEKDFLVTVWARSAADRDSLAETLDASLGNMHRMAISNDFPARIIYQRTNIFEPQHNAPAYRRDLVYSVEWVNSQITQATQIVATPTTLGQM